MTGQAEVREPERPLRVVIVGAGFGGLAAARGLRRSPVQITIIDRQNHHLFQPLLYQVATAAVSPADVAVPIRPLFRGEPNVAVVMDEVTGIDTAARMVLTQGREFPYDYLVLAPGSRYAYFGHDDWPERSLSLKTLDDALTMRERILLAFERAEMEPDPAERHRLMTFVVIGGGPTGVELAGAIAELAKSALARDFRHIAPREAKIVLLEAGAELLRGFPRALTDFARHALERKGVTVRPNAPVQDISETAVTVGSHAGQEEIPTDTVLWAAGTRADCGPWLAAETDTAGRVMVAPDLSLPEQPEIFVIGDAAYCASGGQPLPAVAPVAKQQGAHAAKAIRARLVGVSTRAFRYRDEGMLATIGRGAAVADLRWVKFKGWLAWMFWGLIHIYFLIGFRNRAMVFLNWAWAYFTYGLGARLITRRTPATKRGDPQ